MKDLKYFKHKTSELRGQKEQIEKDIQDKEKESKLARRSVKHNEEAKEILRLVGIKTQE